VKKSLILLLLPTLFLSCEKQHDTNEDSSAWFWGPKVEVEKGDGKATLYLTDPRPFTEYWPSPPSNPEFFNIFYSNDLNSLTLYKKVDFSTTYVTIPNLKNGDSYYFLVTSNKGNFEPVYSDTVMTVPSEELKTELFLPEIDYPIESLSTSFDKSFISFCSSSNLLGIYMGNSMRDPLYYKASSSKTISFVEESAYSSSWSKTKNLLVYLTSKIAGIFEYPLMLKLFDPETKISTSLLEIQYDDYTVINPTIIPGDDDIAFLSSKGNSNRNTYDLWRINAVTKEQKRITNFETMGFYTAGIYDWASTGEEIYLDGSYKGSSEHNIYKLNATTKLLSPVIESQWDARTPSLSPDNTKIAFVSGRTGKDELWIYDMVKLKYSQATGSPSYYFDSRYTNIQWLSNDQILITVFKQTKSIAVKINVN
jgi:hypothetical protein